MSKQIICVHCGKVCKRGRKILKTYTEKGGIVECKQCLEDQETEQLIKQAQPIMSCSHPGKRIITL